MRRDGCPDDPAAAVIVARTLSISFIAALPVAVRAGVAVAVRALIARTPEPAGRAVVAFPYRSAAFSLVRT